MSLLMYYLFLKKHFHNFWEHVQIIKEYWKKMMNQGPSKIKEELLFLPASVKKPLQK